MRMLRRSCPKWGTGCNCGTCNRKTKPHLKGQPRERRNARAAEKVQVRREIDAQG